VFQILWIVIGGAIVGLIARALMRRNVPLWATVCLGIIGALIGNVIASAIGVRNTTGIDWIRHILQIGVACALIALVGPFIVRGHRGGTGGGPSLFAGSGRGSRHARDRSHIDMR